MAFQSWECSDKCVVTDSVERLAGMWRVSTALLITVTVHYTDPSDQLYRII
jgi:hypothetical protein